MKTLSKRTVHRFKGNEKVFKTIKGVKYEVMDLGGSKINIRVRSEKEIARDYKLFHQSK
jgi:hypothetical protein|tara:strand:- start:520 stop:696 length:177 start_codon:yes stop_codon:yes gene_type:complete